MKPIFVKEYGLGYLIKCPECGLMARIDQDQYEGKVSIDCPECNYHETHNLSE